MLKRFFPKGLIVSLLVLSGLALVLFVSGFSQQEQRDTTGTKPAWERVRIAVATEEQYQYLKGLGIDCPIGQMCEVSIPEWQRKEIEKRGGIKVKVLPPPAPPPPPEKRPNQVEYKLVREIDLKRDGVESIVFGPKKDKNSALSDIILGLNEMENKVCVYDSTFNLISKMYLRRVTFSENLRYLGGIKYVKIPQDVTEKGSYKFELFDYTGKKLWELERELYYDASPNSYSVSSKGTVVERDHLNGILTFYDQKGNKIKKIQLYVGTWDPGGQGIRGEFSEDGEYLLIQAADEDGHAFGEGIGVLFFTSDGKELWRFNTEDKGMGAKNISKLNNYVAVSTKGTTYLLSREGNRIKKFGHLFATGICFSSNEKYTLLTEYYHTAYLIRSENGEIIAKYGASKKGGSIYATDIAEEAKVFGVLCSAMASVIGFDGGTLWSTNFPVPEGPLFRMLNMSLSNDGKQLVVQVGTKIMIYQQAE